ncbi:MAG: alpha/beta hydrolase fold family protein [Nevskia sp.]|nr:alpha/beta hydrolase fold family protein [Nevskia sp.]
MHEAIDHDRRRFFGAAAMTIAAAQLAINGSADAQSSSTDPSRPRAIKPGSNTAFGTLKQIKAGVLDVGCYETGPADGPPVILLHGFPYDIHSYAEVAPILAAHGCRVIVPHLRGHGTTRFLDEATPRSGQQAAIGADLLALMDALNIPHAVLAGYDWGGRAACVAAALWPERCAGLVSVNSYLIQDIAKAAVPLPAKVESGLWYQFYFLTERGRAGLTAHRRDIARILWTNNSPTWHFDDATFERSVAAFDNPDYVDVVIHSYRHRLGSAPGYPQYADLEQRLAALPPITVPTITLDGGADGVIPATDGKSTAARFTGQRQHRIIPGVGHNPPQESPAAFAAAVWDLASKSAKSS